MQFLLIFAIITIFISSSVGYDFDFVLKKIPENERGVFLKRSIARGYHLAQQTSNLFEDDLDEFCLELYKDARKSITPQRGRHRAAISSEIVCFPAGCIEIGDIGVHPIA